MMGNAEELPKITWETAEVVKKDAPAPEPAAAAATGKTTAKGRSGPGKKAAKQQPIVSLDVFDRSGESKKPVLLFFTVEKSKDCLTMEKLVLGAKGIVDLAKSFHPVKLDAKKIDAAVLTKYQVRTTPTVILLDFKGKVLQTFVGKITPAKFHDAMKAALAKNQAAQSAKGPQVASK